MTSFSQRGVLFDHDGTLVNSLPVVIAATNAALAEHGFGPDTPERIVDAMRLPTKPRMGYHAGVEDLAWQAEMADTFYRRTWDHIHLAELYPGVLDLLARLHGDGWKLGLVTNNLGRIARYICGNTGAMAYLSVALGEEDMPAPKPDPRGLAQAAAGLGIQLERCVFVGDSATDLRAALSAHIPAIGVSWGAHPKAELIEAGFARIVDRVEDLGQALADCVRAN